MKRLLKPVAAFVFGNALLVGAAAASTVLFEDDFNRSNSNSVGNGWSELEDDNNDVRVRGNTLRLRDTLPGNPDAAAASAVIDATGFKNITVSFTWKAFITNEASDELYLSWAFDPAPALTDQNAWTEVFSDGSGSTTTFSETVSLGAAVDGAMFNLMFWSDVSFFNEGFKIDNVVVTGEAITPVPLPASLPLMAAALAGFGIMRRRKAAT